MRFRICGFRFLILVLMFSAHFRSTADTVELIGSFGGVTSAIDFVAPYAYLKEGSSLTVLNLSNPSMPQVASRIRIGDPIESIVASDGYVLVNTVGTVTVFDISDSGLLDFLGSVLRSGSARGAIENAGYIIGSEFQILELNAPGGPRVVESFDYNGTFYGLTINDRIGCLVVAVPQGAAPPEFNASSMSRPNVRLPPPSFDYYFQVLDFTVPFEPQVLDTVFLRTHSSGPFSQIFFRDLASTEDLAYVSTSFGLYLFDISNPDSAQLLQTYGSGIGLLSADELAAEGTRLHTFTDDHQWTILDFGQPDFPQLLNWDISFPEFNIHEFALKDDLAYAATSRGLRVIDTSDPENLLVTGSIEIPQNLTGLIADESFAYALGSQFISPNLEIIDISNPTRPELIGRYGNVGDVNGFDVLGPIAVLGSLNRFPVQIIDLSVPENPQKIAEIPVNSIFARVVLSGSDLYVTLEGQIRRYDLTNPAMPVFVGRITDPFGFGLLEVEGSFVYDVGNGVRVIDWSNPAQPEFIGEIEEVERFEVTNSIGYMIDSTSMFRRVDLSSPSSPIFIPPSVTMPSESFIMSPSPPEVYFAGPYYFAFIDLSLASPALVLHDTLPFQPSQMDVTESLVIVADQGNGMLIYGQENSVSAPAWLSYR